MVLSSIYVSNLAGLSHRAAIPEARRPQRLPHTDLYADASAFSVLRPPLVLGGAVDTLMMYTPMRRMPDEVHAHNVHAREVHAYEMHACEVTPMRHTHEMHAHEVRP